MVGTLLEIGLNNKEPMDKKLISLKNRIYKPTSYKGLILKDNLLKFLIYTMFFKAWRHRVSNDKLPLEHQ